MTDYIIMTMTIRSSKKLLVVFASVAWKNILSIAGHENDTAQPKTDKWLSSPSTV